MLLKCSQCRKLFISVSEIINHVKYIHNWGNANFTKSVCFSDGCLSEFSSWSGLLRNLKSHETVNIGNSEENVELLNQGVNSNNVFANCDPEFEDHDQLENENISVETWVKTMEDIFSSFCSSLLETFYNESCIDLIRLEG